MISATNGDAVTINSGLPADDAVILGNLIGTDASGLLPLGNAGRGISVLGQRPRDRRHGSGGKRRRVQRGRRGIVVENGSGNTIRGNIDSPNVGLGIDLFPRRHPNDEGDGDAGPNNSELPRPLGRDV